MPAEVKKPRVHPPLREGCPPYAEAELEQIAEAIGVPLSEVLARRSAFENAALWYQLDMRSPRRVPPSAARAKLQKAAAAARKLLHHLDIRHPGDALDGPGDITILDALVSVDGGSEEAVTGATARLGQLIEILEATKAIKELEQTAHQAAQDVAALGDLIVPKEHRGDEAANDWLKSMMELYKTLTGKDPGVSVTPTGPGRGDVGGPLIRFLEAAGRPVDIIHSAKSWRRRIRTVLEKAAAQK